jgi:hypothetical protein
MPKAKAKLAEPSPQRSTAFDVVCDTEEDLMAVIHFARALTFMDGLGREETDAVQRIARSILEHGEAVEDRRGKLFGLLALRSRAGRKGRLTDLQKNEARRFTPRRVFLGYR